MLFRQHPRQTRPAMQEIEMTKFIESSAGRVAARIQAIGAGFDPEVLSLPGGSLIAVLLWLYAATVASLHRAPPQPPVAAAAASASRCGHA
jgi:hypothetical protein